MRAILLALVFVLAAGGAAEARGGGHRPGGFGFFPGEQFRFNGFALRGQTAAGLVPPLVRATPDIPTLAPVTRSALFAPRVVAPRVLSLQNSQLIVQSTPRGGHGTFVFANGALTTVNPATAGPQIIVFQ
jgi:hypothetical protein